MASIALTGGVSAQKAVSKIVAIASIGLVAALTPRRVVKVLAIASTGAVATVKATSRALAIASTSTAAATKRVAKTLALAATGAVAKTAWHTNVLVLAIASTTVITARRAVSKGLAITSSTVITARRVTAKGLVIAASGLVTVLAPFTHLINLIATELADVLTFLGFPGIFDTADPELFHSPPENVTFATLPVDDTYADTLYVTPEGNRFAVPAEITEFTTPDDPYVEIPGADLAGRAEPRQRK